MEKTMILITHGGMSRGVKETLEFVCGEDSGIEVIQAFTEDVNPEMRLQELLAYREEGQKVVILSDIEFGSVNQICARYIGPEIFLITGFNLPLLLQIKMASADEIHDEFLQKAIETARGEMKYMNAVLENLPECEETDFFGEEVL